MMGSLPNCIVIGAMKAGTTSLHNYLSSHPMIFGSEIKELDFFVEERNWKKGLEWYRNQFKSDAPIRIESSQNYSKRHVFKGVTERMYEVLNTEIKFIYIVRHPIERIQSHFLERLTAGYAEAPTLQIAFENYLKRNNKLSDNHYVRCSMYYNQLKPYIERWGSEKIHVLRTEAMKKKPLHEMNRIFSFLNVDAKEEMEVLNKKHNVTGEKRYPADWYNKSRYKFFNPVTKPLINYINAKQWFTKPVLPEHYELHGAIADDLRGIFENDIGQLEKVFSVHPYEFNHS